MQRERLTITLDTELLAAVDTTVDHSQIRNRSHAIEHAIREGLAIHELTQAVLVAGPGSAQLPELITLLLQFPIREYLIVATAHSNGSELVQSVQELSQQTARLVPADFGTGAALLLNKEQLTAPFLYINLEELSLPLQILPAYLFHRRNHGLLTHLLQTDAAQFTPTGIAILEPEIIEHIPAGLASLEATIFPNLAKTGRVVTYVCR